MKSKRQPKVHKYSKHRRKNANPAQTALSVALTFLIAGAIGVVGYSVAKPLLQYDGKVQPDLSVAETAQPATTAVPVATQTETVPATEAPTEAAACESGVRLSAEALQSADALQQALAKARSDSPNGKLLVIPLKVQGGAVLYQTNVETAKQCGAAQGNLTLPQITAAAMEQGWMPVAECSLLYDNLLPKFRVEAGYQTADGSQWLDNSADNGGKPWASPLSTVTLQYLTELTQEIAASDFSQIWFADAVFPPFRDSDLAYIGSSVEAENRRTGMQQFLQSLLPAAKGKPISLEISAAKAKDGTAEAFAPEQFTAISGYVLRLDSGDDTAEVISQWAASALQGKALWLMEDDTAKISGENNWILSESPLANET